MVVHKFIYVKYIKRINNEIFMMFGDESLLNKKVYEIKLHQMKKDIEKLICEDEVLMNFKLPHIKGLPESPKRIYWNKYYKILNSQIKENYISKDQYARMYFEIMGSLFVENYDMKYE